MNKALAPTLLAAVVVVVAAAPAMAHERQAVGSFQMVVGWGDEPAYTGSENSEIGRAHV
jgi:hypothetical protein